MTTTKKSGKGKDATVTTTVTSKSGRSSKRPRSRAGGNRNEAASESMVLSNHFRMLADPCTATLAESAYRGRAGQTSRWSAVTTYNVAGDTAFFCGVNPAAMSGFAGTFANSATLFAPVYSLAMPGQAFLLANADSWRAIGACIDVDYVGTELNRSGVIYGGILPSTALPAGVATSVDLTKVLLSNEVRTPDRQISQLWFPGVDNELPGDTGVTQYEAGRNSFCVLAEGLPPGVQLRLRFTFIIEWFPKISTGLSMPTAVAGTNPTAAYEKLHTMGKEEPAFTHSFTSGIRHRVNQYAAAGGRMLVDGAVGLAMGQMYTGRDRRRIRN